MRCIISLSPILIIAAYIYFRDKYEKEPIRLLIMTLIVGALTSLPIMLTESLFALIGEKFNGAFKAFWDSFFVASLNEEGIKLIALFLLIWKSKEFNELFDGIIYATFISLGFAGIENLAYVYQNGVTTGLFRAITAVPAHALFGITMGFFFARAKFSEKNRKKYLYFILSFLIPFTFHGIYDLTLMSGEKLLLLTFVPFLIFLWISGFKKMKKMSNESVFKDK